jgi:hypothetical protein
LQLEEMRTGLRVKLNQFNNDLSNPAEKQQLAWQAKEELIKTYTDKEHNATQQLEKKDKNIDE